MSTETNTPLRSAFEAWLVSYAEVGTEDLIYRDGYDYPYEDWWQAYQHAHNAQQAIIDDLQRQLDSIDDGHRGMC